MKAAQHWPAGFDRYRDLFPGTPPLHPDPSRDATSRFVRAWSRNPSDTNFAIASRLRDTTVVFVRGYLGHFMPGNLIAARDALRQLGVDAFVARNSARSLVAANVRRIAQHLERRATRPRLIFCGHSRGGVECLSLLARVPALAERCDGVVLSQSPFGPSRVIESVLLGEHKQSLKGIKRRVAERAQRSGLQLIGAADGGRELTGDRWRPITRSIAHTRFPFPVMQTASWSSRPTAWLDSFHQRLGEIGPGRAHDGQFFLDDLIWPGLPHILLPDVDHAQPAVGGFGFDVARYWLTAIGTMLEESHAH